MSRELVLGLNAVILAVTDHNPRVLTVGKVGHQEAIGRKIEPLQNPHLALPFGPLDPDRDRTLELALRRWVEQQTGLELGYVEQLYTFGDQFRDPREKGGGPRMLSIGYLALVREASLGERSAQWKTFYRFLPWEDHRRGRPPILESIESDLGDWTRGASSSHERRVRQERADLLFGAGPAGWDGNRVLERYELLWEAELVEEAKGGGEPRSPKTLEGVPMALDHRRILATALGRIRGKLKYRPVVFELMPERFTLLQLQKVVEALAGLPLHKQNFRRLVERGRLVKGTGEYDRSAGGRPAELYSFRGEVVRERPAPGVGLPGIASG